MYQQFILISIYQPFWSQLQDSYMKGYQVEGKMAPRNTPFPAFKAKESSALISQVIIYRSIRIYFLYLCYLLHEKPWYQLLSCISQAASDAQTGAANWACDLPQNVGLGEASRPRSAEKCSISSDHQSRWNINILNESKWHPNMYPHHVTRRPCN